MMVDLEFRKQAAQGLIRYYTNLVSTQPHIDEWRDGLKLAKRWFEILDHESIDQSLLAGLVSDANEFQSQGGSGAVDLYIQCSSLLRELTGN
jgi:hypothetical protein